MLWPWPWRDSNPEKQVPPLCSLRSPSVGMTNFQTLNHESAADINRLSRDQRAADEHKNKTVSATSSVFPNLSNGWRSIALRRISGSEKCSAVMSVSTYPGAIAFTRICLAPNSIAQLFVNESTAALVAPYRLR